MLRYDPEHMPLVLPERTQVAWTYPTVKEMAASGVESFVRRARLRLDTDASPRHLDDALRLADLAIEQTAAILNVEPIHYRWFLYHGTSPDSNELNDSGSHYLIPDGYSLVARVENIYPTVVPDPATQAMLSVKIDQAHHSGRLILGDLNMEHVAFDATGKGRLVDIDPEVSGDVSESYYSYLLGFISMMGV